MGLEKQESLPFEEEPPKFSKEKICSICGLELGDNPENCRACQSEVIKRKKKSA